MTLAPTLTTLDALKAGQSATVIHLAPSANAIGGEGLDVSRRLMELGFVPGERIRMLKRGFTGGPLAVKVGQSTFALRRFEAALVSIQPE
ncbi:ferrous iron transport protein A [Massilia forsythiae]|uniref:Ferrous iron transport protein A n=1 Tax=Massilia forsythiae TaxID=2728020 RepID=A0A7Z2VWQ4_9BURK|nr:FeoA family protein [Massilia forsythiae]QJE00335.1 ferrous iron transport protein A [Massilia forsythiae]